MAEAATPAASPSAGEFYLFVAVFAKRYCSRLTSVLPVLILAALQASLMELRRFYSRLEDITFF